MKQIKHISKFILAATLVALIGCASTAKQEGTGEYIDDSVITTKVKAAVLNDPGLKSSEINVETFKEALIYYPRHSRVTVKVIPVKYMR